MEAKIPASHSSLLDKMEKELPFSSASPSWLTPSVGARLSANDDDEEEEAVIRGLSSDRLFFDAAGTSSLLVEAKCHADAGEAALAFDGGVAVAVDSTDPSGDFLISMEEMVEAHGVVRDWAWMLEMLGWFLRANGKANHGFIISAFLDLVVSLASSSFSFSSPSQSCPQCSSSCSSSSSYSCEIQEIVGQELGNENG